MIEENGGGSEMSKPEIERFDRVRAAIHDRRDGPGGARGPHSPPHNVFVGSGGVGIETDDGDHGSGKACGGGTGGDRVRLVSLSEH